MKPAQSGKNDSGDFDRFKDFARRLVAVPHAEIKAKLDAEKAVKKPNRKRTSPRAGLK